MPCDDDAKIPMTEEQLMDMPGMAADTERPGWEHVGYLYRHDTASENGWAYSPHYPEIPNTEVLPVYARTTLEAEGDGGE